LRAVRKPGSGGQSGLLWRAAIVALGFLILVVAPTAFAGWHARTAQPIATFSLTPAVLRSAPDPIEAKRIAAMNKAIPVNPHLAVPAAPFSLRGSLSQASAVDCMTAAIYYEAANESITGQRAVAQVVLNRMRHPAFPNSVCAVVFQGSERRTGCQFTFTCDGSLARRPSHNGWRRAQSVAFAALSGLVEPSVGHATHYHAAYVLPYWAKNLTKITEIGSHIFYQWRGPWASKQAFSDPYNADEAIPVTAQVALDGYLLAATYTEALSPTTKERLLGQPPAEGLVQATQDRERRPESTVASAEVADLNGSGLKISRSQITIPGAKLKDDLRGSLIGERPTLVPE
jgi:spore germination cell wall hydrolase CwlJ-like protein